MPALAGILLGASTYAAAQSAPPPIVIRSNQHSGATIWSQDRPAAPAQNGSVNLQSQSGAGASAATVNATGSTLQVNTNTVAQPPAMVVQGAPMCPASTPTWTASASCSGALPQTLAGSAAVTATDSIGPAMGSATYTCQADGTWSAPSAVSCTATCGATTASWAVGANTCTASLVASTTGQTRSISDATAPTTGAASYTCSAAGTWGLNAGFTCAAQPPLGSLASDIFIYSLWRPGGDYHWPDLFIYRIGFLQAHGLDYGDAYSTIVAPTFSLPQTTAVMPDYTSTYLQSKNCQPQTRTLLYAVHGYVNIPGLMCRPGYTP